MALPMGTQGQADFSQPIALMMDCHRRIEHFLGVLEKVVGRYRETPLDEEQLLAVGEEMKQRRIDDPGRSGSRCAERRRDRLAGQSRRR